MKELFTAIRLKISKRREMVPGGFEKDRETLRYLCPAKYYGTECQGQGFLSFKERSKDPSKGKIKEYSPRLQDQAPSGKSSMINVLQWNG